MTTIYAAFLPKFGSKFYCEKCDYGTSKKSTYDSHMLSAKHMKTTQNRRKMSCPKNRRKMSCPKKCCEK